MPLIAACLALAGGGWLGFENRWHSNPNANSSAAEESTGKPESEVRSGVGAKSADGSGESLLARAAERLRKEIQVPLLAENPTADQIRTALENGTAPWSEREGLVKRWAQLDPAGFWRSGYDQMEASSLIFQEWVRRDPDAAFLAAARCKDSSKRQQAVAGILEALPVADAELRRKIGAQLDVLARGGVNFTGMGRAVPAQELSMITTSLLGFPPGVSRDQLLRNTAGAWFWGDWQASAKWAATLSEPLRSQIKTEMAEHAFATVGNAETLRWSEEWLMTEATPAERQRLGPGLVSAIAQEDPAKASAWAQENLAGWALGEGMREVVGAQVAKDPAAAHALVEGMPPGGLRDLVAAEAIGKYTVENARWLAGILAPEHGSWENVGSNWARQDPAALKQFLAEQGGDPEKSKLAETGIISLTARDPQATLDWTLTLPPANTSLALGYWASYDPKSASAWLTNHSGSQLETVGVEKVSAALMRQSPQSAVDWAASFPAGTNREDVLKIVRGQLAEAAGLSAEEVAALKARVAGGG